MAKNTYFGNYLAIHMGEQANKNTINTVKAPQKGKINCSTI